MNHFKYKLIGPAGNILSGFIKLPYNDVMSAITHLERDGSLAIYVKKPGAVYSYVLKILALCLRTKLSRAMQAELLSNVALMLRSGVSLTTALEEAAASSELSEIEHDINDMITSIQGGAIFSEAAKGYKHIFPETVIHLIRIGEETGQLDKMLKDASDHLKNIEKIISDTKQALLYPAFVFFAMGLLLVFWFYYVVPKILTLFKEMDVTLPFLTVVLMNISNFLQNYFLFVLFGLVLLIVTIIYARKMSRRLKKITDALLLKLPISSTIISASILAYLSEYLSLLVNAGVDILGSVAIIRESVQNEVYREKLGEVRSSLTRGESIADSFAQAIIFPNFVTRMIGVGELSGTLTEQLDHIAEEYRNKLSIVVATLGKIIEPLVLIIAGAMFAVIIGGLLLPIYDLISKVSR